jgi:hypothetical protein
MKKKRLVTCTQMKSYDFMLFQLQGKHGVLIAMSENKSQDGK